jgi:hypothetical protein
VDLQTACVYQRLNSMLFISYVDNVLPCSMVYPCIPPKTLFSRNYTLVVEGIYLETSCEPSKFYINLYFLLFRYRCETDHQSCTVVWFVNF